MTTSTNHSAARPARTNERASNGDIPHDEQVERAVLAILLIEPDMAGDRTKLLSKKQFHDLRHRTIYCSLSRIIGAGGQPDVIGLHAELKQTGDLEAAGGLSYIADLPDEKVLPFNFGNHVATLNKQADTRGCLVMAERILRAIADGEDAELLFAGLANYVVHRAGAQNGEIGSMESDPWLALVDDGADILAEDIPDVVEIVDGLVTEQSKVVIGSGSKSFKTWLTIYLALCMPKPSG